MQRLTFFTGLVLLEATVMVSPLAAQENLPKSTSTMTLPLVRAYPPCSFPTTCLVSEVCVTGPSAGAPCTSDTDCGVVGGCPAPIIGYGACPVGTPATTLILGPKGSGSIVVSVVPKSARHPLGDIKMSVTVHDVRDKANSTCDSTGKNSGGLPCLYTGSLSTSQAISATEPFCAQACSPPGWGQQSPGTTCTSVSSFNTLATSIPCTAGLCKASAYSNDLLSGSVDAGHLQNIEIRDVYINDFFGNPFLTPGLVVR